ncbi:hypothetical protein [Oligoflexus tunisiensis]|uniref:hypothetical protein n=1 Tax=Oligoflexus tunisiensis TaxID=708132 RepID=UPI00114CB2E0|nr:hypothetical protein [Oligoflexus tunisiensis]
MNIIEIVFENIPCNQLLPLLGKVAREHVSESILSELDLNKVYNYYFPKLAGTGFSLIEPHVRIIKYDEKYDLEVSIDLKKQAPLSNIMLSKFFATLAQEHQVKQVYGGLEPASDEDTRIFTGFDIGPVALDRLKPGS